MDTFFMSSKLVKAVAAALVVLVALLVSYALLTLYENAFTPAAMNQSSATNTKPSVPGELSRTAARGLHAYGGEAVWKSATEVVPSHSSYDPCRSRRAGPRPATTRRPMSRPAGRGLDPGRTRLRP